MNRDERDEQIWLYAAGALSDAEMQSVRAMLEKGTAEDLSSLSEARETLARLPEVLEPVTPSARVLNRLMTRVNDEADAESVNRSIGIARPQKVIWPMLVAAAAACVAVVSVLNAVRWSNNARHTSQQLDQALAALETARDQTGREASEQQQKSAKQIQQIKDEAAREIAQIRTASARQIDELKTANASEINAIQLASAKNIEAVKAASTRQIDVIKAQMEAQQVASAKKIDELLAQSKLLFTPNLQFTSLQGQDLPRGGGRVLWDKDNRKSHVYVFDMVPPAEGKVYELWFIEPDKAPVPAGTFTVDANGNGSIESPIPEGMDNIAVAAITEEPAGGSLTPTMPIKLMGNVQ